MKFGEKGPIEGNKGQKTKKTSLPRVTSIKGDRHASRQGHKAFKLHWVEIIILFNPFIPENFTKKMVFEACQQRALSILFELASQTSQVVKRIPVLITAIQPDHDQSINKINGMLSGGDSN